MYIHVESSFKSLTPAHPIQPQGIADRAFRIVNNKNQVKIDAWSYKWGLKDALAFTVYSNYIADKEEDKICFSVTMLGGFGIGMVAAIIGFAVERKLTN